jgi:hypothetical protein
MGRADDWAREAFIAAVVGPDWAEALAQRQAELLDTTTAGELDDWRAELEDLAQVQGTRYYTDAMRRRHGELRRLTDQATAKLLAAPDLAEMQSLPRSEAELRRTWERWSVQDRRVWLKRVLDRIEVKPAAAGVAVEDRFEPVFRF